ncbi:hypothetical protein LIPSTDRAFT_301930 [Lipomyces starkeyi NRRL Y-11557]|uniref:Uncharacterized protein n=1 Tax=Lipomyces starkeyi NRRL Y-11557 TaxID=675824 RepID=A0A1E3Q4H3_LIPST|nr:hypothetical protein LIPSTDRAFT_301930 [Lipomyces starkeyi NRRL Y-11557]
MIIDGRPFIMSGGASRLGLRTTQEHTSRSSTGMKRFFKADVTDAEQLEKAVDAVVAWTKETVMAVNVIGTYSQCSLVASRLS